MKHFSIKLISACALILLCSAATKQQLQAAAQAPPVLSEKFDDSPAAVKRLSIDPNQWSVSGGVLKSAVNNNGSVSLSLAKGLADFTIEYDARIVKVNGSGHFGFDLRTSSVEGKPSGGKIYCWPSGALGYLETVPNESGRNIGIGALPKAPGTGPEAAFIHFRYVCIGKLIHIYVDNQFVCTIDDVSPRNGNLTMYSYNLDIEVDNITIALLGSKATPIPNGIKNTKNDFDLSFDKDTAENRSSANTGDTALKEFYCSGLVGRGLSLGPNSNGKTASFPRYSAKGMLSKGASVMFWIKPDFDYWAPKGKRLGDFLSILDSKAKPVIRMSLNDWSIRGEVKDQYTDSLFYFENRAVGSLGRGDWHHVALIVDPSGLSKLYLDGMLYSPTDISMAFSATGSGAPEPRMSMKRNAADLSDADTIVIGSLDNSPRDCALDEISVVSHPVSDSEVVAAYRHGMPADIIVERTMIRANKKQQLTLELHPAGELPCSPGKAKSSITGTVKLTLQAENSIVPIATMTKQVTIGNKFEALNLPIRALPDGNYRLTCSTNIGGIRNLRSFPIMAYSQKALATSTKGVLSTQVAAITVNPSTAGLLNSGGVTAGSLPNGSPYLEVGEHKMDRLSFPIDIPQQYTNGRPMILEITWPDDKIRNMGLYLYPKSAWPNDRDRLEGGLLAGGVNPNSGEMKTVSYVIYPWVSSYLLEVRTMAPGRPAAVASVRLLTAPNQLPKADMPNNIPATHRMVGHVDEDQSFDYLTGSFRDLPLGAGLTDLVDATQKMVDYLDYTGQDVISYPILRYSGVQYALPGSTLSRYSLLGGYGVPSLMMDMLAARGKKYIVIANFYHLPELNGPSDRFKEFAMTGYFIADRNGKTVNLPNPVHPEVRSMVLKHVQEVLRRFAKSPAFAGLNIWHLPIQFGSLEQGYDDYSVSLFEKETGIHVPASSGNDRFTERYAFLTVKKRTAWLAWRAGKVSSFLYKVAALVSASKKDCLTYVSLVQPEEKMTAPAESETLNSAKYYYEQFGLDFTALDKCADLVTTPLRRTNTGAWKKHWDNSDSLDDEFLFSDAFGSLFHHPSKLGLTSSYNIYFESFNGSLSNETYQSMFQNADVKPNGRHFLREFAFNLATADPSIMLVGGQPMGSAGRDYETREFAAAFRALPAKPFKDIRGAKDPVCARYLVTPEGVYLYAVNRLWTNATATITFNTKIGSIVELSNNQKIDVSSAKLTIQLEPYQLKTYRITTGALPVTVSCGVDAAAKSWYHTKAQAVTAEVKKLTDKGIAIPALTDRLKAINTAVTTGQLAEAHRLLFSKMIDGEMPKLAKAAGTGYLSKQAEMVRASHYAINCGSDEYYTAKSGTLFFPDDRPFSTGGYGYIDKRSGVTRDVSALRGVDDPKLFETEAYDVSGYKFTVNPGRYTVVLYLRIGYPPAQKTGANILSFTIAGQKLLDNADMYTICGENVQNVAVKVFKNILVKGNVLEIGCMQKDGIDPSARLFNAIEVIPE